MSEMYGQLRVDNGKKKIQVNDAGDYIEISANDARFYDSFMDMLRWIDGEEARVKAAEAEIAQIEDKSARTIKEAELAVGLYKGCAERIDGIFGADACKKIFGDVIPDEVLINDFLDQITPIIAKLAKERGQRFEKKYNRQRRGGK